MCFCHEKFFKSFLAFCFLMAFIEVLSGLLERSVSVVVTLFFGLLVAKIISRIIRHVWSEAELNLLLKKAGLQPFSVVFSKWIEYIVYAVTFLVILNILDLTWLFVFFLVVMLIIGLVLPLLLALRDFVPNFLVGLFIKKKLRKQLGKKIKIGVVSGVLKEVRSSFCVVLDKEPHFVPYVYVLQNK
ncbi:hypothetical protein DRJ22_01440 [Candidatus Woesearchaeota archaeon]|nr:MAG: hypothetical protein DRJ22_01440 [Candidatus Woesearchaeota archaeon]